MIDLNDVIREAKREYELELFREAVEKQKQHLREKRSIWDRVFPWRIVILKKGIKK